MKTGSNSSTWVLKLRDGSNMVIKTKTSFFEYIKAQFIEDLLKIKEIETVDNALAAKAATDNSGGAIVEYSVDVTFKVQEDLYTVKLTAYTTSCRLMFQPVGGNPQVKLQPGSKSIPRYFVDNFFLPWCEEARKTNTYDENKMMDSIRSEIKKLDAQKLESKKIRNIRGRLLSVASSDVRCVAKGCKYTGINSNNKSAVGVCAKCGGYEHFECSKTKPEIRDEINKGTMKYYCSTCFMKNPSSIAFDKSPLIPLGPLKEKPTEIN